MQLFLVVAIGTAACSAPDATRDIGTGGASSPRMAEPIDCGEEHTQHGANIDVEGRQCLLEAFLEGRQALFVSAAVTIEGAPIIRTFRVLGPGIVEIEHDARQDPLGSGQIEVQRCERLVPVEDWNAARPDEPYPPETVFIEDGCEVVGTR